MISSDNINSVSLRWFVCRYFLQNNVCKKTIIIFGFCDILNNQGRGKCYQPRPSARQLTLPRPWLFRISQKPHPIIVYYQQNEPDSHDSQPLLKIGWNSLLVRPFSFRTIKLISNHSWFLCSLYNEFYPSIFRTSALLTLFSRPSTGSHRGTGVQVPEGELVPSSPSFSRPPPELPGGLASRLEGSHCILHLDKSDSKTETLILKTKSGKWVEPRSN